MVVIVSWVSPVGSERPPTFLLFHMGLWTLLFQFNGIIAILKDKCVQGLTKIGAKGLAVYFQGPNQRGGGSDYYG